MERDFQVQVEAALDEMAARQAPAFPTRRDIAEYRLRLLEALKDGKDGDGNELRIGDLVQSIDVLISWLLSDLPKKEGE